MIFTRAARLRTWLPCMSEWKKMQPVSRKKMRRCLAGCAAAVFVSAAVSVALIINANHTARQRAEAKRAAAEAAAASEAAAQAEAERAASEAAQKAEEQRKAEEAALRQQQIEDAAAARENVQYGDKLGTVWVEGTEIDCDLYWGDSNTQFDAGAGCHAENGCVLPGENGTVFVGAHTGTYFADLGSAEVGARIHLQTDWGDFVYEITETQVIYETDIDKVRWGATEPSCILYTCYPFGILTHTDRRYAVYADPVEVDENGVIPQ